MINQQLLGVGGVCTCVLNISQDTLTSGLRFMSPCRDPVQNPAVWKKKIRDSAHLACTNKREKQQGVSGKGQNMCIINHTIINERGEELSVAFNRRINYCSQSVVVKLNINLSRHHGGLSITAPDIVNNTLMDVYFISRDINLGPKRVRVSARESIFKRHGLFTQRCRKTLLLHSKNKR